MNLKIFKIIINFLCLSFLFSISEPLLDYKQNKNYDIIEINIENAPVIDGHLNDAVWMNVPSIQDFIQEDPLIFGSPTFKTEVKLLYDQKNIYLYAKLYHDNPEDIAKHLCRRDDWMQCFEKSSDWFTFDLDPMHSHNSGYIFAVNAAGVQVDAAIVDELALIPYDENWDGLWLSQTSIDEDGWNLEIQIALSNFSSYQNDHWGLNFSRYTKEIDETSSWVVIPRYLDGTASKFGHMRGFSMDKQSRYLSIKPSFSACKDYSNAINSQELTADEELEGLDLFNQESLNTLRFIPSVDFNFLFFNKTLLSATINPDYGQIELDPEEVNLTAYQTYYTEKRDFFLEDNFIFSLPIELFYSRRVGEKGDIQWASKIISQEYENFTIASIFSKEESRWANISRLQKNFLSGNSFAGLTSTLSNRDNMLIKSLSLDGTLSLFDNTLLFDGQILFSEDSLNMEQNKIGKGLSLEGNYIFPYTEYFFDFEYFDKSLNINELGYLERNNLINMEYGLKIRDLNPGRIIRSKSIKMSHRYQENIDHIQLKNDLIISGHLEFMNYLNFESEFIHSDDSFDDYKTYDIEYDTFGPKISSPAYNLYKFSFKTNELNEISLEAEYFLFTRKVNQWDNFTDHNNKYEFGIKLRPFNFLTSTISYETYNRDESLYFIETIVSETLDNNGNIENESLHYVFSKRKGYTDIISVRLDASLSPKASIQVYTEYYKNHYSYSDWRVLDDDNSSFPVTNELFFDGGTDSDGIVLPPLYFSSDDNSSGTYLNPNESPFFKADYRNLNFNCVFKWEYIPGANFYLAWVYQKNVAGEKFDSVIDFLNYDRIENYNDIFENQSLHIKFDYWFNI